MGRPGGGGGLKRPGGGAGRPSEGVLLFFLGLPKTHKNFLLRCTRSLSSSVFTDGMRFRELAELSLSLFLSSGRQEDF